MAFCTECGANVPEEIKFCTSCGKQMEQPIPAVNNEAPAQPTPPPVQQAAPPSQASPVQPQTFQSSIIADAPPPKGSKYAVMGVFGYLGTLLLFCIPIVGLIFCIMWAFSGKVNRNRRNFARAYLILLVVGIIFAVVFFVMATTFLNSLWDAIREATDGQFGGWGDLFDGLSSLPLE